MNPHLAFECLSRAPLAPVDGHFCHGARAAEYISPLEIKQAWRLPGQPKAVAPASVRAPGFPVKPAFIRHLGVGDREKRFGRFEHVADPTRQGGDGIRILGDWDKRNIETFVVPIRPHPVLGRTFRMTFHRAAKQQVIGLWLAWEAAGLLDRVITWDGAYVARYQRSSRRPKPANRPLSNHAYGTAFDINAGWNGLGAEPAAVGSRGCVRELVPLANQHGFFWGGHFGSRKDGMHFEVGQMQGR
jgi:hypothetical protein